MLYRVLFQILSFFFFMGHIFEFLIVLGMYFYFTLHF